MYNPIFEECLEWTMDPDIIEFLQNLSNGNFPKEIKLENKILFYKNKKFIITTNSFDNFKIILEIYKELKQINSNNKNIRCEEWSLIRSKKIKARILIQYVISNSIKYNIPFHLSKKLFAILNLAFLLKIIKNDDIEYENGKILKIKNIEFYDGSYKLFLKNFEDKFSENSHIDKISQSIDRYIKEYKNSLVV